jgi:putative tryptophan/tyrosine transport system substrate-binding protein
VGILFTGGRQQTHLQSLQQGLQERGYVEGKNVKLEYKCADSADCAGTGGQGDQMKQGTRQQARGNSRKVPIYSLALGALLYALCSSADAQQATKIPRIGFLEATSFPTISPRVEAFRQGLLELGYVEGKNIHIEYRWADGKFDRLPNLASELVSLKVDVIVTGVPTSIPPAKKATATIPIVMSFDSDPVGSGFVASLAHPGGNITGLSSLSPEISGKQLELLKEIVPRLSRVVVLGTSTRPGHAHALREVEVAAGTLAVRLQYVDVRDPKDIEIAFRAASKGRAEAVLALGSPVFILQRTHIADLAVKNRLPAIYDRREFVEDGGLLSYGVSLIDLHRRSATYVDKILKGAKPADLPVEQPTKFEFIINLKAAKQIGLTIPPTVLARADKVIK